MKYCRVPIRTRFAMVRRLLIMSYCQVVMQLNLSHLSGFQSYDLIVY